MTHFSFSLQNATYAYFPPSPSRLHVTGMCMKSRIQKETISGTRKRGKMAERGDTTSCSFQTDVRRRCATGRTARVSTPRWNMRVMRLQKRNDSRASENNTTKVEPGCYVRVLTIIFCHFNSCRTFASSLLWNKSQSCEIQTPRIRSTISSRTYQNTYSPSQDLNKHFWRLICKWNRSITWNSDRWFSNQKPATALSCLKKISHYATTYIRLH